MATKIKNLNRLNKKFIRLSQGAIDAIRPAMAAGADDIVAMAKRFAPVDTGALRDSIGWTWGSQIPEGSTALGSLRNKRSPELIITIFAGSKEVFYVKWKEFGTVAQKAHPFFFPAYRAQRKSVKSKIRRAITKAAKLEAGKG